jgi:branched-chain amino acid aminotransferase
MVLLNQAGRVAEATGAALVMVRDGVVITPPATEGALESITLVIVFELAESLGLKTEKRPIDRTELHICDEIAIVGTLAELVSVEPAVHGDAADRVTRSNRAAESAGSQIPQSSH